jgi:hypothetical protein
MPDKYATLQQQQPCLPFRGVENESGIYLPLDPTSQDIRYLRLNAGRPGQSISCTLGYTTLDTASANHTPYVAVSYCWGDVTDTIEIELAAPTADGIYVHHPYRITRNLHAALLALRFTHRSRVLWVDAVCISQNDPKEKTHQVGLLSYIFSSAEEVVVWLGEEDTSSRLTVRFQAIAHAACEYVYSFPSVKNMDSANLELIWTTFIELAVEDEGLCQDLVDTAPSKPSETSICSALYESLDRVLGRPWFRRIWVFQEVLLSPRGSKGELMVTMLAGTQTMTWQAWARLTRLCFKAPRVQEYKRRNLTWFNGAWYKSTMLGGHANYAYYFDRTRKFLSTDPRDKLFALLHIASDTRERTSESRFCSDYEKTLCTIVLQLASEGIMIPMLLRTTVKPEDFAEDPQADVAKGHQFRFELLYPADPYANFEFYDSAPSPFAERDDAMLPYCGKIVTRIARKLDLRLGRAWCKERGLLGLHRANRIDYILNEVFDACRPLVRETDVSLMRWYILRMLGVSIYDMDPSMLSRSHYASILERTWFWTFACTGSWSPYSGYGAPQLFITTDNKLVMASDEAESGDFIVHNMNQNLMFTMAVDRRQQNSSSGDYRFAGMCSFYLGELAPAAVDGLSKSPAPSLIENFSDSGASVDAFDFQQSDDEEDDSLVRGYAAAGDTTNEQLQQQDDTMFEDYLDSEEHLSSLKEEQAPLRHETASLRESHENPTAPHANASNSKSRFRSLRAMFPRRRFEKATRAENLRTI